METITISMHLRVTWMEWRLWFNTPYKNEGAIIYLNMEDQNQVWSPKIVIGSNMISHSKQGETFAVGDRTADSFISFYLITTLKCEMDYQTFPFDKHICKIEVSISKNVNVHI